MTTVTLDQPNQVYTNALLLGGTDEDYFAGRRVSGAILSANATTLTNLGVIGSVYGAPAIAITGNAATIINQGTIQGSLMGGVPNPPAKIAIQGGGGADSVTNNGNVYGSILLGDGNDSFVRQSGFIQDGVIDLGAGDDHFTGNPGTDTVVGGSGTDTFELAGSFDFATLFNVSGFERLLVTSATPSLYPGPPSIAQANGFSSVDIAAGVSVAFSNSVSPDADVLLHGSTFNLDNNSRFHSIIGSDQADSVAVSQNNVQGTISLGGGDDRLSINGALVADGGAGSDTLIINTDDQGLDLTALTGFEHLQLTHGTILNATGFTDVATTGFVTIRHSDLTAAFLSLSTVSYQPSVLTIAADVQLGRIGTADSLSHKAELAAVQEAAVQSNTVTNNGTILGDVQLGMGHDFYQGKGSVGGTIYGYADSDVLYGGDASDRIDGGYGPDFLGGYGGDDILLGQQGNDFLDGGTGNDLIDGGDGDDTMTVLRDFSGLWLSINALPGGDMQLTFATSATAAPFETDTFRSIEHIQFFDDTLGKLTLNVSGQTVTYAGVTLNPGVDPALISVKANTTGGFDLDFAGTPAAGSHAAHDIGSDGRSDILWRNANSGSFGHWAGNADHSFTANANLYTAPTDWKIAGAGDFNGDGRVDLLWRNDNGQTGTWSGNGNGTITPNATLYGVTTDWKIATTGDFNGDGRDDILWRNANSGQTGIWTGNADKSFTSNATLYGVGGEWKIAGAGDFNGDGRTDILWRNVVTGQTGDWLGNTDGSFTANANLYGVSGDWKIAATGDFNGDGRDDVLWRSASSGQTGIWTGNANQTFTPNSNIYGVSGDWKIMGAGDFNGDGRDDILWRSDNGQTGTWSGNTDGSFTPNAAMYGVTSDWVVQLPHDLLI